MQAASLAGAGGAGQPAGSREWGNEFTSSRHRTRGQSRADPPRRCSPPVFVRCSLQTPSKLPLCCFSVKPRGRDWARAGSWVGASQAAAAGIQPGRGCAGGCGPDVTQQRLPDSFGAAQSTPYSRGLRSEIFLPFSFHFFFPPVCSAGAGRGSPQPLSAPPSADG